MKCGICFKISEGMMFRCPRCNIDYCSLKCYEKPVHLDCVEKFKKAELDKILNKTEELDIIKNYDEIRSKINHLNVRNDDEAFSAKSESVDFHNMQKCWSKLSRCQQQEFFDFIEAFKENKIEKNNILYPWWISLMMSKSKVTEVQENSNGGADMKMQQLERIVPDLSKQIFKKTLQELNSKSSESYNLTLALMVHRLLLVYVAIVKIYGNRKTNKNPSAFEQYDNCFLKHICKLAPFLYDNIVDYKSYEKLVQDFEYDICHYFKKQLEINEYYLTEEFCLELYKDYMVLLVEASDESLHGVSCPLYFFALSEIQSCFKKSSNKTHKLVNKKLTFYMSWCQKFNDCDHFLVILNYLQYRSEYLKSIIAMQNLDLNKKPDRVKPLITQLDD